MKIFVTFLLVLASCVFGDLNAAAQSIVNMELVQNPPFGVSVNEVSATYDGMPLTLGANVVITGGSGVYDYRWAKGETVLGASATITVDEPGDYTLDVKDRCDCRQTVVFHITKVAFVNAAELGKIVQTTVFNDKGQLVRVFNGPDVNLDSLPKGLYLLNRVGENGSVKTIKMTR